MNILVVEDEQKTAVSLTKGLIENGFAVDVTGKGDQGFALARTGKYDLLILDVMLPGQDGWSILTELRRIGRQTPVLFLTACDSVPDRVKGLELGADDYLVKPFAFAELVARVRTLLRRGPSRTPEIIRVADLEVDVLRQKALRGGTLLDLTPKQFSLLLLLTRRAGEALSRNAIAEQVWGIKHPDHSSIVDVHIARIRAKVDGPFERKLIHTVWGIGYVLEDRLS
jgi:two-component system, OmpR family, copper resistance phosphate regulon response regulator CusR